MQQLNNELLIDIRSFYADYEIVNNVYSTAYNQKLLHLFSFQTPIFTPLQFNYIYK